MCLYSWYIDNFNPDCSERKSYFDGVLANAGLFNSPLTLQIEGLGTALKILFSEKEIKNLPEHSPSKGFQLTRQEIVALLNAFGRLVLPLFRKSPFKTCFSET